MSTEKSEAVLMLPVIEEQLQEEYSPLDGTPVSKGLPLSIGQLQDLVKDFPDFNIDTIELFVKGVAESGPVVKYIVGLEGEASVKLVLKRNN